MDEEPAVAPAENKSKYIRTFAKDVAGLGQTIPKEFTPAPASKKPTPRVEKKPVAKAPVVKNKKSAEETFSSLRKTQEDPSFVPVAQTPPQEELKPSPLPFSVPIPAKMPVAPAPAFTVSPPKQEEPSPIHTYKSDFADHIDTEKASTFSVLAEQLDSSSTPAPKTIIKEKSVFPLTPVLIGIVLLLAGGGGVWFAYTTTTHTQVSIPTFSVKTLVFADDRKELAGPDYSASLVSALNDTLGEGKIRVLYSATASSTETGILHIPNDGSVLISSLNLHAPDLLLRNIDAISSTGMITMNGETSPFFALRTTSYERTFSAMLSWESTMTNDLAWLYPAIAAPQPIVPTAPATTTATSTTKTKTATSTVATSTPQLVVAPTFKDRVVGNYNLRVLTDSRGNSILCYGYTDKQTLIIARNPDVFVVLAGRIVEPK